MKHLSFNRLLTAIFLFLPTTMFAEEFVVDGIKYSTLSSSTVEVAGYGYSGDIVIPAQVEYNSNGYSVTSIGKEAFYYCLSLTSVTIPESVKTICNYAFTGCSGLKEININTPSALTSIGLDSFKDCSGLTAFTLPDSLTTINGFAFARCSGITAINIPSSVTYIGNYAFAATKLQTVEIHQAEVGTWFSDMTTINKVTLGNEVKTIGASAFKGCSGLTEINTPSALTSIGNNAFEGCSGLRAFTLPSTLTTISNSVFKGCSSLTTINIPNVVASIGDNAFEGCAGLTAFTLPSTLTTIGSSAFKDCTGITTINIPASITSIGSGAFSGTKLQSVELHTPKVGNWFSNLASIKEVVLGDEVESIEGASGWSNYNGPGFYHCTGLTTINIPSSVTNIGNNVFDGCSNLSSITIPSSVTSIGGNAFAGCQGLEKVELYCKQIDNHFCGLKAIKEVTIGDGVESIGNNAFNGCSSLKAIMIPSTVTSIGVDAFINCSEIELIKVNEGNAIYDSRNNSNAIIKTANNELLFGCKNTLIPNSVTRIGASAFAGCSGLTEISFPESVATLSSNAFEGCTGLTSIVIPKSINSIGRNAFKDCSNLSSVELHIKSVGEWFKEMPSLNTLTLGDEVTSIGSNAFHGCTGLTVVSIPNGVTSIGTNAFSGCTNLESVTMGDKVKTINDYAFWECSALSRLKISEAVTSIGTHAFSSCISLTTVKIPNSVKNIGRNAFFNCNSLEEVVSMIETPFDIDESVFRYQIDDTDEYEFTKARLSVPENTKALYEAKEGWKEFINIIERIIDPDNNGDVDFEESDEINGDTDLNGNVIGNIYYNIAHDAGSYSSTEGCINVVKPTSDEQVQQLEGQDIFGEEFRNQFTGIVFKVEAGKGTIKVKAETKGNMVLKVKIGNNPPMEMELEGKIKATFPYNVSEPTYVYIYAGQASASVKAMYSAATEEPGELKIYGIEWSADEDWINSLTPNPSPQGEGSIYNLAGQRLQKPQRGVNIVDGKKVVIK